MEEIRYLKLFENFQDIDSLCDKYKIRNWTINDDGNVDVDGDVNLSFKTLNKPPIKFGRVGGNFWFSNNHLSSLEGCPEEVGGFFDCSNNELTSLEGCPKEVGGNELSLEGLPRGIGGSFFCSWNKLTSLEGCPKKVVGDFDCSNNKLTIIDYLPEWIEGNIHFDNNKIRDIKVEDINYRFFW